MACPGLYASPVVIFSVVGNVPPKVRLALCTYLYLSPDCPDVPEDPAAPDVPDVPASPAGPVAPVAPVAPIPEKL